METMEAILTRRSVRRFTPAPVTAGQVETLLRAAMSAPSSSNAQPWHFVVISSRAMLDDLAEIHPSGPVLRAAPLAILVCADERAEKNPGRWMLDCSAAMQNLLLAAHALDLGAVWLAVWPNPERVAGVCRLLDLPENIRPLALAAAGHPAETPPAADRYDPARVHNERW